MPKTIHKNKTLSTGWSVKFEANCQLRRGPLVTQAEGAVDVREVVVIWGNDLSLTYEKKDGNMVRRLVGLQHRKEGHGIAGVKSITLERKAGATVNEIEINPKYELIHRMMLLSRVINGKFDLQKVDICEDDRSFVEEIRDMDVSQQRERLSQMKIERRAFD